MWYKKQNFKSDPKALLINKFISLFLFWSKYNYIETVFPVGLLIYNYFKSNQFLYCDENYIHL